MWPVPRPDRYSPRYAESLYTRGVNRVARSAQGKTGNPPLFPALPSLPLEVGPLNPASGSGGALWLRAVYQPYG